MKVLMLMDNNSYPGREYLSKLIGLNIDVATFGKYPEKDAQEDERCGNLWIPTTENKLEKHFNFFRFSSLKSHNFLAFLKKGEYELGIQGGTGIIKKDVIDSFNIGIINFHPGNLPFYRGCSAPEWQLLEENEIICTAHFIDEGIDTGEIIEKFLLKPDLSSYEAFRASIYPQISDHVRDFFQKIFDDARFIFDSTIQDENEAQYRKYIGDEKIDLLREYLKNGE